MSAVMSGLTISTLYEVAMHCAYPLPFAGATGLVLWFAILLGVIWVVGKLTRTENMMPAGVRRCAVLLLDQIAPTCIYTLYNAAYEDLTGGHQPFHIIALPLLKLATKNTISRPLQDIDDLKPEVVIFNIEIFRSLFIACCMPTASSSPTNFAALVVINLVQPSLVLRDVRNLVHPMLPIQAKLKLNGGDMTIPGLIRLAQFVAEKDRHVKSSQSFRASCCAAQNHVPSRRIFVVPMPVYQT